MEYVPPRTYPVRVRPKVRESDRKRSATACWRCRDRKIKCVVLRKEKENEAAVCQRCHKYGYVCTFGSFSRYAETRGPGRGYSGPVERDRSPSRGQSQGQGHGQAALQSTSPTDSGVFSAGKRDSGRAHDGAEDGRRVSASSIGHQQQQQQQPQQDGMKRASLRPGQRARVLVKNAHQTYYVGEVSNGTFISEVQDAVVAESPEDATAGISPEYMQVQDAATRPESDSLATALEGFPPKSVADFLVSTFFHTVEANYYYMDRDEFKGRLDRYYETRAVDELDASFVSLVLMVFAMGSQFAELRAPARQQPSQLPQETTSKHGPGMVFYTRTKPLLSDVITQCSLESIQVFFLIGLFLLPSNISDLSYVYHDMALKMAIAAGLHREVSSNPRLDQKVLHVRNRLWWSLYTSERRLTIILDRPESIREEDIDAPLPQFCAELDLPTAQDNIANLRASIDLTRIYNRVVRLGKRADFASAEAAPELTAIREDLEGWLAGLPPRLHLRNLNPEGKSFRGAVHLHMCYNQIIIYMGRAVLLRQIQRRLRSFHLPPASSSQHQQEELSPSQPLPPQPPPPPLSSQSSSQHQPPTKPTSSSSSSSSFSSTPLDETSDTPSETALATACVEAAYKIVDLLRYLAELGRLARFSFTDLNCCSVAGIIVLIHEILRRHPLYGSAIATVLASMRFMATGCQNAQYGLRLIQNLESYVAAAIRNLRAREKERERLMRERERRQAGGCAEGSTPPPGQDAGAPGGRSRLSEYEQWQAWMAEAQRGDGIGTGTGTPRPQHHQQQQQVLLQQQNQQQQHQLHHQQQQFQQQSWTSASSLAAAPGPGPGQVSMMDMTRGGGEGNGDDAAAAVYGASGLVGGGQGQGGAGMEGFMTTWQDELSSLGLSGFESLDFPGL